MPDRTASAATIEIAGKKLQLSNLNKVYYPATGFTKARVIDYYIRIAPAILPHLVDRPVTLKRYPEGVDGGYFYQKRCSSNKTSMIPRSGGYLRLKIGNKDSPELS